MAEASRWLDTWLAWRAAYVALGFPDGQAVADQARRNTETSLGPYPGLVATGAREAGRP